MQQNQPRRVPIGNTIAGRWRIRTNGAALPLEGRDLTLNLIDKWGQSKELDFSVVNDNIINFVIQGKGQNLCGTYIVELYENYGQDNQARLDKDGFEIVPRTKDAEGQVRLDEYECVIEDGQDYEDSNLVINAEIELDGDLAILTGSPYIQNGYWYIDGRNLGVQAEGITPHVGDNGNWFNGETDTGQPAYLVPHYDQTTGEIYYLKPTN